MTETDLLKLARDVASAGLVVAAGGNVAARREDGDLCVTPTGVNLAELTTNDVVKVTLDGETVSDGAPTSELPLHLAAFRARPDVAWSVHLHPPTATLLSALGIPIRMITTDHAFYLRHIATVPYLHPGSVDIAEEAAKCLLDGTDVVLLAHHGCLIVADTPELAFSRAVNLEAAAVATYRAALLGDTATVCPPEFLEHIRREEADGHRYGPRPPGTA